MSFVTIVEARKVLKGNVIVKVVSLGEMKTGDKSDGTQFRKQQVVLKDNSDVQEMILWDSEIGRLDQGKYYKLEGPYWKMYKDTPQLSLGKYCKITECMESDLLPAIQTPSNTSTTGSGTSITSNITATNSSITIPQIPDQTTLDTAKLVLGNNHPLVMNQLQVLWALEVITRQFLRVKEDREPEKQHVGMYMKILADKLFDTKNG